MRIILQAVSLLLLALIAQKTLGAHSKEVAAIMLTLEQQDQANEKLELILEDKTEEFIRLCTKDKDLLTRRWVATRMIQPLRDTHEGWSAIHFAAYTNNRKLLRFLLKNKVDINSLEMNNQTALFCTNNLKTIRFLARHGTNVNHYDAHGKTLLFYADEKKLARLLLDYGANVNHPATKEHQFFPIFSAVSGRDVITPLDSANERGKTTLATFLKKRGARLGTQIKLPKNNDMQTSQGGLF